MDGYTQTLEVYGCADCSGCEHKAQCLYKYNPEKDADKNKVMKINERWEELKEKSNIEIDRKTVSLNDPINKIGEYTMLIKLTSKVKTELNISVSASEIVKESIEEEVEETSAE